MENIRAPGDFEQVLSLVERYCKGRISDVAYTLWLKDLRPIDFEGSTVYLSANTIFKRNVIREKYAALLKDAYGEVMGFDVAIDISSDEKEGDHPPAASQPGIDIASEYEYTFETFIVGSSNKFAHAASLAVASNPSDAYNPLFIYGSSGLGKTHLLTAICREIRNSFPHKKQLFVHGETFTNELIDAIKHHTTSELHQKYRSADILLVDDIQFIGGKESTQEEFFHTFNALYQDNKQIILTSDRPPKEIKTLEERLRTRFESGLLADVQPPDFETRIAIIKRKAEQIGIEVPGEVAEYIAGRLKNNIRQLEGAVKKLKAYKLLQGLPPSIMVAQSTIRDVLNDNQPVPVTIERIISEVARTYGVSAADIRSNKRSASISGARQISAYVIKEITQISHSAIGKEFGNRDHSTIVYAIQQVEKNIAKDPHYKEMVEDIIKNIRGK